MSAEPDTGAVGIPTPRIPAVGIPTVGIPTVGIIANPAAGKDIRRLVSAASPVSDMAKIGIVRRAAIGAIEGGAHRLVLNDDRHALTRRALRELPIAANGEADHDVQIDVLDLPILSSGADSQRAAAEMAERGVGVVIVLGGDGTHRDVVKGWRRVPMVALSTGTNNVFPRAMEATTAGHAAGLVAAGTVPVEDATDIAGVIDVTITDRTTTTSDLALVDVALTSGSFTGSRAVWDPSTLREVVTVIAEPASVGLSAIAASVAPTDRREPGGVHVTLAPSGGATARRVRCAIAPGRYADLVVEDHRRLDAGDEVRMTGPGVLSFDGERDVVLGPEATATLRLATDGPKVIDVARTMLQTAMERS